MNTRILNRDFTHPADGWYQIEAKGVHRNRAAGIDQVIDDLAIRQIVERFNADAAAGRLSHGHEMLIDHEHFKHDLEKETVAYGWLQELQARDDGYYGRIRWTGTGRPAVDQGDYRFFSTEYDPQDLAVLNSDGKVKRVRPTRLDGLTLTNSPNNKGGKPITNRGDDLRRSAGAPSADAVNQNKRNSEMKTVAMKLGLSAEASEEAIAAELTKVMNRMTDAEGQLAPMKAKVVTLEAENQTLLGEQCDALMDAHGVKADAPVRNRLRPVLVAAKNREDRMAVLKDFGFTVEKTREPVTQTRLMNRDTKPPQGGKAEAEPDLAAEKAKATKIMNRATAIQKEMPGVSLPTAVTMAQREIESAS